MDSHINKNLPSEKLQKEFENNPFSILESIRNENETKDISTSIENFLKKKDNEKRDINCISPNKGNIKFEEEKISSKFHTMKDKFKALGKTEKYSTDAKKLKDLINTKLAYKTLIKNLPDWIIAIPRAALTIALIPPILKYVFGLEKKKAPEKVEIQPETKQTEKPEVKEDDIIFNRPAFEDFNIGGNK